MNVIFTLFKKNKIIFISTFLILTILSSFFIYKMSNPISQANLIKFHSLTAMDPLFYDPNTDVNLLRSALLSLKKLDDQAVQTNSRYLNAQPNNYKLNVFPKGWNIWPESFLATLPQIHVITTDFLANPTPKMAIKLLDSYKQAIKQYGNAINLDIQAMQTFLARNPEYAKGTKTIVFLRSATTPQIVLDDFMIIRKNAQALENELTERKKCLFDGLCSSKNIPNPIINDNNAVKIPFKPLLDEILDIDRSRDVVFGPFYASTGCFRSSPGDQIVYSHPFFVVEKNSGLRNGLIIPMLTNTKFYQDFRSSPEKANSILWQKHGYLVRNQDALTDYLCTDQRYLPQLYLDYLKEKQRANNSISTQTTFSVLPYLVERSALGTYMLSYYLFNNIPQNPLYMLINRSAYSLYFGTFTSRIWRLSYSPTFLTSKPFSSFGEINASYQDLVEQGLSQDEIVKFNFNHDPRTDYEVTLEGIAKSDKK